MEEPIKKKRGRPAKVIKLSPDSGSGINTVPMQPMEATSIALKNPDIQQQIVETIKEIFVERIIEVPQKQLEDFELYAKLRDLGFPQGGMGATMENVNGVDKAYVPEVSEVYQAFILNPDGWGDVRDSLCREWIKIKEHGN